MKMTRMRLAAPVALAAILLPVTGIAGDCANYSGTTCWVGEKHFNSEWRTTGDGRWLAFAGDAVVTCTEYGRLTVFDVSDPTEVQIASAGSQYVASGQVYGITAQDSLVFVASRDSLHVLSVADPTHVTRLGTLAPFEGQPRLAGGDGLVLAVVGASLRVIDVRDPFSPSLASTLALPTPSVDVTVRGQLAIVATEAGIITIDITDPLAPQTLGVCATAGPYSAAVAVQGDFAYLTGRSGLDVLSIADPSAPVQTGHVAEASGNAVAVEGPWAVTTGPFGSGLRTLDITDPEHPRFVGNTGSQLLTHCGVVLRAGHAFTNANDMGHNITGALLVAFRLGRQTPPSLSVTPAWPDDGDLFTLASSVEGDHLRCLTSHWVNGVGTVNRIDVLDLRSMAAPSVIASLVVQGERVRWYGGVALVTGADLEIVDLTDPAQPRVASTLDLPPEFAGGCRVVATIAGHAHITAQTAPWPVAVVDVRDPTSPALVTAGPSPLGGKTAVAAGNLVYAIDADSLHVVDAGDPMHVVPLWSSPHGSQAWSSRPVLAQNHLWFAGWTSGGDHELLGFDLADPVAPSLAIRRRTPAAADYLAAAGDLLLLADTYGVYAMDVSRPAEPLCTGMLSAGGFGSTAAWNGMAVLADWGQVATIPLPCTAAEVTSVAPAGAPPASAVALLAPHPNPFNPVTRIPFLLAQAQRARVAVYDLAGRRVTTLANEAFDGGRHELVWRGTDARGAPVASGSYVVRVEGERGRDSRRVTLLR